MRSYDEYKRILMLWEEGLNKSEIERQTGIPRPTIRDCINKFGTFAQLIDLEVTQLREGNRWDAPSKTEPQHE